MQHYSPGRSSSYHHYESNSQRQIPIDEHIKEAKRLKTETVY